MDNEHDYYDFVVHVLVKMMRSLTDLAVDLMEVDNTIQLSSKNIRGRIIKIEEREIFEDNFFKNLSHEKQMIETLKSREEALDNRFNKHSKTLDSFFDMKAQNRIEKLMNVDDVSFDSLRFGRDEYGDPSNQDSLLNLAKESWILSYFIEKLLSQKNQKKSLNYLKVVYEYVTGLENDGYYWAGYWGKKIDARFNQIEGMLKKDPRKRIMKKRDKFLEAHMFKGDKELTASELLELVNTAEDDALHLTHSRESALKTIRSAMGRILRKQKTGK